MTAPADSGGSSRFRLSGAVLTIATAAVPGVLWTSGVQGSWEQAQPPSDFELRVVEDRDSLHPRSQGHEVWVFDLRIDGRAAGEGDVHTEGAWESQPGARYVHRAAGSGSLRCRARALTAELLSHPWSGAVEVRVGGQLRRRVDLYAPESRVVVLEMAAADAPLWTWLPVAVFSLLALCLGPWRTRASGLGWLLVFLGGLHLHDWLTHAVGVSSDSVGYLDGTISYLLRGEGHYFPPGYGLFVHACGLLPGLGMGHATALVQHALVVAACGLLFDLTRRFVPPMTALFASLLAGSLAPVLISANAVMSEAITMVLATAVIWLLLTRPARSSVRRGAFLGAGLAFAGLTRVIPFAVLGPLVVAALAFPSSDRQGRDLRLLWISLGSGIAIVAAAMTPHWLRTGDLRLSIGTGKHLYNHFVNAQRLLDPEGPWTRELLQVLQRDIRDLPHWEVSDALREAGVPEPQGLFMEVALEAAATASLPEILWFDVELTAAHLFGDASSRIVAGDILGARAGDLAGEPLWSVRDRRAFRAVAADVNPWLWPCLAGLFCLSVLVGVLPNHRWLLCLAWAVLGYLFLSSAVEFYEPRYNTAVAPLVVVAGITGAAAGWRAFAARRRRAGAPPGQVPPGGGPMYAASGTESGAQIAQQDQS